jgi:HlyD family secretion protein
MRRAAWSASLLPLLFWGCARDDEGTLPGTLERDRVELVADADEFIVSLPLAEGATVKIGDVIVVQDDSLAVAELQAARAQLAEAEARVQELENGPLTTTIRAAAARRDRARVERDDAVRERDRLLGLVARSLVSKSEADRQVTVASAAQASLEEAESALRELQRGTRVEQLAQARQAADSARATVAVLVSSGAPYARVHVPESVRARMRTGTAAKVHVDGVSGEFAGKVRFVATEAEFTPYYSLTAADRSRLSFLAEVVIDDPAAAKIPSGVPLEVTLELGPP